jgi:hypothetical protein
LLQTLKLAKVNAAVHSGVQDPSNMFVLESYVGKVTVTPSFLSCIISNSFLMLPNPAQGRYGHGMIYRNKGRASISDQ